MHTHTLARSTLPLCPLFYPLSLAQGYTRRHMYWQQHHGAILAAGLRLLMHVGPLHVESEVTSSIGRNAIC